MKTSITKNKWTSSSSFKRKMTFDYYYNYFFNLFLNAYKFPELTREQNDYILRKFWSLGSIASFIVKGTKLPEGQAPTSVNEYPNGMIAFAPFAPFLFNIYDWPIQVNLVQIRGATFIPNTPQIVNKDVVIGYAQRNKHSIESICDFYINKIVDVEMTIAQQLMAHKTPFLLGTTPENEERIKKLFERISNDEEVLYVSALDVEAIKTLQTGNQYILDKLFNLKDGYINALLTRLGFNNVGMLEKKEHSVVDEVNANNQVIMSNGDNFLTCLEEFCEDTTKYLGFPLSVISQYQTITLEAEEETEEEETEEDKPKGDE